MGLGGVTGGVVACRAGAGLLSNELYIYIYPIALRASPATVPGKRSHYRVFFQKCLAALGTLPAKCVTGYSEMMGPLSQFLFGLVMLGTLPGNRVQK